MALPQVTMECRAVGEPELRFTPSGAAVANLRVVAASRKLDKSTNEWVDDKDCWLDVTVWQKQAENVAESVRQGDLLIVSGRLHTESWEDRETGAKRSKMVVTADHVALSVKWDVAKSERQPKSGQQQGQQRQEYGQGQAWGPPQGQATQPQQGWSQSGEPPF